MPDSLLTLLHEVIEKIATEEKKLDQESTQKFNDEDTLKRIIRACILEEKMMSCLNDIEKTTKSREECAEKEEELKLIQDLRTLYERFYEKSEKKIREQRIPPVPKAARTG